MADFDDVSSAPAARTSGKAIASFLLGFPALLLPILPSALGILFGIFGLIDIGRTQDGRSSVPRLKGRGIAIAGIILSSFGMITGCLAPVLLVGAIQAERRLESMHQLQTLALAMQAYHDTYNRFPPAVVSRKDGKPLYSWRVLLLPFLDQKSLYEKFHLDEPWDSPANLAVLAEMPLVFVTPGQKPFEPYATHFQVIVGPGAVFDNSTSGRRPLRVEGAQEPLTECGFSARFADITDGASGTILLVEAANPVPWTKPQDVVYTKGTIPALGGVFGKGFAAAFADASVSFIPASTRPETIEAWITRAGGEVAPGPGARAEVPAIAVPPSSEQRMFK